MLFKGNDCLTILMNCLLLTKKDRPEKVLNESINPPSPKNPDIQALINEIINNSSLMKPRDKNTAVEDISSQYTPNSSIVKSPIKFMFLCACVNYINKLIPIKSAIEIPRK